MKTLFCTSQTLINCFSFHPSSVHNMVEYLMSQVVNYDVAWVEPVVAHPVISGNVASRSGKAASGLHVSNALKFLDFPTCF